MNSLRYFFHAGKPVFLALVGGTLIGPLLASGDLLHRNTMKQGISRASLEEWFSFTVLFFLLSLAFQLFYSLSRILVATLSRFQKHWNPASAGVVLFVFLLRPALSFLNQKTILLGGYETLFILIGFGLFLLLALPHLRGSNPGFFAISAVLIVWVLPLFFSVRLPGSLLSTLPLELLLTLLLFGNLQIRHRLFLNGGYETSPTPPWFIAAGLFLSVILWLSLAFPVEGDPFETFARVPVTAGVLHWSILALLGNFRLRYGQKPSFPVISCPLILILFVLVGLFPFASLSIFRIDPGSDFPIFRKSLIFIGRSLDRDGDGNSLWPGMDPDDDDPCVQALLSPCRKPESLNVFFPWKKGEESLTLSLFTVDGPAGSLQLPDTPFTGKTLLVSSLPDEALMHLIRLEHVPLLIGVERRDSIFSHFAMDNFRTICTGTDGGEGFFRPGNKFNLDRGCQIFQALPEIETRRIPTKASLLFRRYREKKSVFWFHQNIGSGEASSAWKESFLDLLKDHRERGPVLVLFFNLKESPIANVHLYPESNKETDDRETSNRTGDTGMADLSFWFSLLRRPDPAGSRKLPEFPMQSIVRKENGELLTCAWKPEKGLLCLDPLTGWEGPDRINGQSSKGNREL